MLHLLSWIVFAIICVAVVCAAISIFRMGSVYTITSIFMYIILTAVMISTAVFMTLAMIKFLRVVSHQNMNIWLIAIQIFGLAFWTLARLAAGTILVAYYHNYQEYLMDRDILICGIFGFFGDVLHFFIIAYVIYKSSIVAGNHSHDKEQKRVTLLSKLQDQHKDI